MIEEKIALIVVIAALYLGDCILVLRPTQAVATIVLPWRIVAKQRRRRRAGDDISLHFGWTFYPVRGLFPAVLNPLTPAISVFKTTTLLPSIGGKLPANRMPMHRLIATRLRVRTMSSLLAMQAVLLFGAVPYFLLYGPVERLLTTVLMTLITAAVIVAFSYPLVGIIKLKRGAFWSLAFQALICLPLSVNFPRKLALSAQGAADVEKLFYRLARPAQRTAAQDMLVVLRYSESEVLAGEDVARVARLAEEFGKSAADE